MDNLPKSKDFLYDFLIQPSHLFLKQVIKIIETKSHILVMDLRKSKGLFIPDKVLKKFEKRLNKIRSLATKHNEYEGIIFLVVTK